MKSRMIDSLVGLSLLHVATASAGVLQLNLIKNRDVDATRLDRRGGNPISATLYQAAAKNQYSVNLTVGTPPQSITVQVDTGSSDVWFPDSAACQKLSTGGTSCDGGDFDYEKSSTFVNLQSPFQIGYGDGTGASGVYFNDTLGMGSASVTNFQMGLATKSTTNYGLIGIGYDANEDGVNDGTVAEHNGFVDALINGGLISTAAFSLWLDDLEASTGSILFGGIDTAKYSGNLMSIDVYPSPTRPGTNITEFIVALTSLSISSSSGTDLLTPSGFALAVVLDSGSSITTLPADLTSLIYQEFGATNSSQFGSGIVPCSAANKNGSFTFGFGGTGGPSIQVPLSEMVLPVLLASNNQPATDSNGNPVCQLGITAQAAGSSDSLTFGDSFLRSAFAVYDTYNNQIALAQTVFNATNSNVVAFPSLGAAIPSAATAPSQAAITPLATAPVTTPSTLAASSGLKASSATDLKPLGWTYVVFISVSMGLVVLNSGMFA